MKTNKIPKGFFILETIFDSQDRYKVEKKESGAKDIEEINLGTIEAPKNVYIGKKLAPKIRQELIGLLIKYRHVFSWPYDDLKAYIKISLST